jgi:hypothetical protein
MLLQAKRISGNGNGKHSAKSSAPADAKKKRASIKPKHKNGCDMHNKKLLIGDIIRDDGQVGIIVTIDNDAAIIHDLSGNLTNDRYGTTCEQIEFAYRPEPSDDLAIKVSGHLKPNASAIFALAMLVKINAIDNSLSYAVDHDPSGKLKDYDLNRVMADVDRCPLIDILSNDATDDFASEKKLDSAIAEGRKKETRRLRAEDADA